jgi:GNAT superfamily N-acetyltransferase
MEALITITRRHKIWTFTAKVKDYKAGRCQVHVIGKVGVLFNLRVRRTFKRKGLATLLIKEVKVWARSSELKYIRAQSEKTEEAKSFWISQRRDPDSDSHMIVWKR